MQTKMRKKQLAILLLAVPLTVSCFTVSYGKENDMGITSSELAQTYDTLYTLKAISANSETAGDIAEKLEVFGWWPKEQNWFIDVADAEIMDISFQIKIEDRDNAERQMMRAGTVFLALFDNLTEINFSYILENNNAQIEYGMCWDLDAVREALGGTDVKSYATSEDKFSELIEVLQNW